MSMLISIINDGTSGQSAWDCGEGRGAARWFVSARTPEIKVRRGFSWWSDEVNEAKKVIKKKEKNPRWERARWRDSANQYRHPHHSSGSWWQGEEEEHQWRLNERVESEKWLRGAECGRFGGGWFIHGATRSSCIRAGGLCVAGREMRNSCASLCNTFFFKRRLLLSTDGKVELSER